MKYLYFVLFLALIACSSSDESSNNSNQFFNPPNWIQGTWGQINDDPYYEIPNFRFKSDDFCTIASNTELCFKESLTLSANNGGDVNVEENITSTSYEVTINQISQTINFKFIKISDNNIEFVNPNTGLPNTQLYKLD